MHSKSTLKQVLIVLILFSFGSQMAAPILDHGPSVEVIENLDVEEKESKEENESKGKEEHDKLMYRIAHRSLAMLQHALKTSLHIQNTLEYSRTVPTPPPDSVI